MTTTLSRHVHSFPTDSIYLTNEYVILKQTTCLLIWLSINTTSLPLKMYKMMKTKQIFSKTTYHLLIRISNGNNDHGGDRDGHDDVYDDDHVVRCSVNIVSHNDL